MQNRIGRSADSHIDRDRVQERLTRHDVARLHIVSEQLHDGFAGLAGKRLTLCKISGDRGVPRQRHTKRFRETVHGVCGAEDAAGAAAGGCLLFDLADLLLRELADGNHARHFVEACAVNALAFIIAAVHGAARDQDARDIETRCRDQHTGRDLIAVSDHNERIKLMPLRHGFNGVRDQLTARERIPHTGMPHGNTVAQCDSGELESDATRGRNTDLDLFRDLTEMDVAGVDLVERVHDADQRLLQIFVRQTGRFQQGSLRRADHAVFDLRTAHSVSPSYLCVT